MSTADENIRREALAHATALAKLGDDPSTVLAAARQYEEYLRGR